MTDDIQKLKRSVKAVLKNNDYQCSICIQNVETNITVFVNLSNIKVSWKKSEMVLFIPNDVTFQIPYTQILKFYEYGGRHIEIILEGDRHCRGRSLLSIREAHKTIKKPSTKMETSNDK